MQKTVLITGVSSGIGLQIALILSENGYKVYGTVRNEMALLPNVSIIKMDITNSDTIKRGVNEIIQKEGAIDILINNAGSGVTGAIEETSVEDARFQLDTNFFGMVSLIKEVLPIMRHNGGGTIINISSIGGLMGLPFQGFYAASKFAVEGYSESLRMEVKAFNIKVILINPGDFYTQFTANRKTISISPINSVYGQQFNETLAVIENDETNGLKPVVLAKKVLSILKMKNPAPRYVIATPMQKFAVLLLHILPDSWFFAILSDHYKIK